MTAGLLADTIYVRLADGDRAECQADGWANFEPMHGRRMREYLELPSTVIADIDATRHWTERAAAHVRTLPRRHRSHRSQPSGHENGSNRGVVAE